LWGTSVKGRARTGQGDVFWERGGNWDSVLKQKRGGQGENDRWAANVGEKTGGGGGEKKKGWSGNFFNGLTCSGGRIGAGFQGGRRE